MGILFANHAKSVTLSEVLPGDTEISCSLDGIATYPQEVIEPGNYFYVSAIHPGRRVFSEIMRVDGLTEDGVITVERGKDGSDPVHHPAGTSLEIRIPAIALNDILKIANEGLDGPRLERFSFETPALEWVVEHGRGTTLFDEKLWVLEADGVYRKQLALTEVVDANSFRIRFVHAVSGYVDVRF